MSSMYGRGGRYFARLNDDGRKRPSSLNPTWRPRLVHQAPATSDHGTGPPNQSGTVRPSAFSLTTIRSETPSRYVLPSEASPAAAHIPDRINPSHPIIIGLVSVTTNSENHS